MMTNSRLYRMSLLLILFVTTFASADERPAPRATGDLGVVIERAAGRIAIVDTSAREKIATVDDLGDLSHASVVYSRDERYAYVFGRDGGLTKYDQLTQSIVKMLDVPCQYPIPELPQGKKLNQSQIQVNLTSTDSAQTLPQRASAADCAQGGWFFDAAAATINLCPATCTAESVRSVEVLIGCLDDLG